jgi:predicted RNA-binding Zn-ribbon protein involved in translation (DUF1610 family)
MATLAIVDVIPAAGTIDSIRRALEELKAIRTFIEAEFVAGVDFGTIPGTGAKPVLTSKGAKPTPDKGAGGKPTLLQPGAQKAFMFFNTYPKSHITRTDLGGGHREIEVTTSVISRSTREEVGEGVGSCSTMEKKYRVRSSERLCPNCGKASIRRSKEESGRQPEWYCWQRIGGCGRAYLIDDRRITEQAPGSVENPDIADCYNTVLKMAIKRSQVAAAMTLGCLSELFTQDLEDMDVFTSLHVREAEARTVTPPKEEAKTADAPRETLKADPKPEKTAAADTKPKTPKPQMNGRDLFRWAAKQDEDLGTDLVARLSEWGRKSGLSTKLVTWTPKQVAAGKAKADQYLREFEAVGLAGVA